MPPHSYWLKFRETGMMVNYLKNSSEFDTKIKSIKR